MSLATDLSELDVGDVVSDVALRAIYSHDASIFEATPEVVICPRNANDVEKIVGYATGHSGVAIVARGGGTDMSGAAIGPSMVMDMSRHMHQISEIERESSVPGQVGVVTVQPGMWYRDFERATLGRNLMVPSYPASREICTIGGMVANNSGGERSLEYGKTLDYVRSVRVVCADGNEYAFGPLTKDELQAKMVQGDWEGNLYKNVYDLIEANYDNIQSARPAVSKNSSGYYLWDVWDRATFNMAKLLCGSQGTLGVFTEMTLGLIQPKPHRSMTVGFLRDLAPVGDLVKKLLPLHPESIESFDDKTLAFTLRFLPGFVKRLGARNLLTLAWQFLPEVKMFLTGGLPKLIVMTEFSGDDSAEVQNRAKKALEVFRSLNIKSHLVRDEKEARKYWVIRRESFNVIRAHTHGKRTTPFIDDFIVNPEYMPEFLPKLYVILEPYKLTLTIAGHVGNGNFHIIPLMDLRDARTHQIIPELSKKVYDLVLQYRGSITAEHNDGLIRGPYVEQMFGSKMYELFRRVKRLFDPNNIFNPGKKIDVDWSSALAHIRKD